MIDGYSAYWDGIKEELSLTLNENEIYMWINRLSYKNFDIQNNILRLSAPSNFIKDNVYKLYLPKIIAILKNISAIDSISVIIEVDKNQNIPAENDNAKNETETVQNIIKTQEKPPVEVTKPQITQIDLPLPEIKKTQENVSVEIDENYSFESFVVGSSNEFAAQVCKTVAENPGTSYNPVFIWGESGLGKTHLLKSISNYIRENQKDMKVKYVTAEEFTNDFVRGIRVNNMQPFKDFYRSLDTLIIDDVQFFANKEVVQQELFNTFETLYEKRKQMVFSADQPISKLRKIEERIKTRFAMGLPVDLRPADYELKMAILNNMADSYELKFDNDAVNYICTNIQGNIRELKGAFNVLRAYSSIMKVKTITMDIVLDRLKEKIIGNMFNTQITVDKIIHIVGEYYDITTNDLIGSKRTKSIAHARQMAMYLSRKNTRLSTTQIGSYFGNKEHGTVMHATKKIEDLISTDQVTKSAIINLTNRLKSYE